MTEDAARPAMPDGAVRAGRRVLAMNLLFAAGLALVLPWFVAVIAARLM